MTNKEIAAIIRTSVSDLLSVSKIIFFGSRVKGLAAPDSDYDILIITPTALTPNEKLPFRTKIRKILLGYGIISDVLIQGEKEAEVKKTLPGHVVRAAFAEGVVL